ncbi:unnamed protein product [Cuscuta campestris]|uniref:Uncharacterized protein n=1 Tax=Cuscuta campestris TaxID=132261 RepID=A0A484MTL4_9ASTE|nr:unnamed protein product [Cuscuta campestris]
MAEGNHLHPCLRRLFKVVRMMSILKLDRPCLHVRNGCYLKRQETNGKHSGPVRHSPVATQKGYTFLCVRPSPTIAK